MAGLKWGLLVGIALKFLDTFVMFASADPVLALLFLVVVGVCMIPRIGFAAVLGVSLVMSKFTSVNLFMTVCSAGLIGAALGCLPGMAVGGIIGLSRRNGLPLAKDAAPESGSLFAKAVVCPCVCAGTVWTFYLLVFMPWAANLLAKH